MTRTVDVRINVIRNGVYYSQLLPISGSPPQLRMEESGGIPTSFSGDFVVNPNVDWLSDELQPVLEVDGTQYPLGVFMPATINEQESESTAFVHVEAYDRCWRVRDTRTESMIYIPQATNYVDAIENLLVSCGVTVILSSPTDETFSFARQDWQIGTSYLDIVNALLAEINYKPLWFDTQGTAILEPVTTPTASNIQHVLDQRLIQSLLLPEIQRTSDIYSAPNVILCICSSPDRDSPMIATAENTNPESPLSIARRGRRIVDVYNVSDIASQTALQDYANRLLFDTMASDEVITVSTALLPGFGVGDITALQYGDLAAICIESSWTMSLEVGGTMVHTLRKVVFNLAL